MKIKKLLHLVNDERKLSTIRSPKACSPYNEDSCTYVDDGSCPALYSTDICNYDYGSCYGPFSDDRCDIDYCTKE